MPDDKLATVDAAPMASMLDLIARAVSDPTVDANKLKELVAMGYEHEAREARKEYFAAMGRLQAKIDPIARAGKNPHTKSTYATLDDLIAVIRGPLAEEGFAISYGTEDSDGKTITFTCTFTHRAGHADTKKLPMPIDGTGSRGGASSMNDVQKVGSTTSYARRYLLNMHLNLSTKGEDDDASGQNCEPITPEQVAEICVALAECGLPNDTSEQVKAREGRFLNWLCASSIVAIQQGNFDRAMKFLKEKKRNAGAK